MIEGSGGSLTKIGTGTLILSGASTYTGDTNVKKRGVLQVDGSINSNTSVHGPSVFAGTGTINGNVVNTDSEPSDPEVRWARRASSPSSTTTRRRNLPLS